jgi:hypothetical protein
MYSWSAVIPCGQTVDRHDKASSRRSPSLFYLFTAGVEVLFPLDHTQTYTTVGRTPLDEGSARRRGLYMRTHKHCTRQASMPPVGFKTTIPASARLRTYALGSVPTNRVQARSQAEPNRTLESKGVHTDRVESNQVCAHPVAF